MARPGTLDEAVSGAIRGPDFAALLARVAAAEGRDIWLDCDLTVGLGGWTPPRAGIRDAHRPDVWRQGPINHYCPHEPYTASLDAALALRERALPDWFIGLQQNRHRDKPTDWTAYVERSTKNEHEATALSPALALLAAMLKALIAQGEADASYRLGIPGKDQS